MVMNVRVRAMYYVLIVLCLLALFIFKNIECLLNNFDTLVDSALSHYLYLPNIIV